MSAKIHYKEKDAKIGTTRIHYAVVGSGPPIVFIHGWSSSWIVWKPMIPYLQNHFTLYLLDLPGFGDSDSLAYYCVENVADTVADFISQVCNRPVALVGASMGSVVTAEVAKKYPQGVAALILMGPIIVNRKRAHVIDRLLYFILNGINTITPLQKPLKQFVASEWTSKKAAKYVTMHKMNWRAVEKYCIEGKRKMKPQAYVQMGSSVADYHLDRVLPVLKNRTLLVYGEFDKMSDPRKASEKLASFGNKVSLSIVEDAGHAVTLEKPKESSRAIQEFLRTLPRKDNL